MGIRRSHSVSAILMTSLMVLVAVLPLASASLPVAHVKKATFILPPEPQEQILSDGSRAITYHKATNYMQLVNWYKALEAQYPNYLKVWKANNDYSAGQIANRSGGAAYDYWMVRLTNESRSGPKPEVLFVGAPHGDETVGPNGQYWFCNWILRMALNSSYDSGEDDWLNWILDNRVIYLSVTHNPDGFDNQADVDWNHYGRVDAQHHDLNREADWDFVANYDEGLPWPATGSAPWDSANGKTLKEFIDHHQIMLGADIHGGVRELLYPWSSKHSTVSASSQKSGVSYPYAPPDFNFFDISSLRLGKFIGNYDGGFDSSNVGPVPETVGYEAPGGIVSWVYGGDVINHTIEDPYVQDETFGNYNGSGVLWISPELNNVKDPDDNTFGGDNQNGFGPDVRRFILHQMDLAQPYVWVPSTSIANNSVVNVGDDMSFLWKVNGCLAVDDTFIQWGMNPDPITTFDNTTKHNNAFKGKYWGGSGWENADSGAHAGYTWSETIKAPAQTGDYYFVIRSMVDQVYGNVSNSAVYGNKPYLDLVRERTDPTFSRTIIEDGSPVTIKGSNWWYSQVIHIKVVKKPLVVSFYPKDKATWVPTDTNISVTFDIPMDHAATEAAFKLDPPATGTFTWNVTGTQFIFHPDAPLAPETTYKVGVNKSAKSLMTTVMDADLNFSFKTAFSTDVVPPRIVGTFPVDKAVNVPVRTKIIVNFSEPMNTTATEKSFGIIPSTQGTFGWQNNSSSMVFTPTKTLEGPVDYVFSITTAAVDQSKNHLAKLQSFKFRTEVPDRTPPVVLGTIPRNGAYMVPLGTNITINFSEPMVTLGTERGFNITPYTKGSFTWNLTKGALTFHPAAPLTPETNYTVSVNQSATDLALNPLASVYSFKFTSEDIMPPTILQVFPPDKSTDVPVDTIVRIDFSEPMLDDTTIKAITIEPTTQGILDVIGPKATFEAGTFLAYSTKYNVTISTAATDLNGLHLKTAYKFSFNTSRPPDTVAPRVIRTDPADGAKNVSLFGTIVVTFSEPVVAPKSGTWVTISPQPLTPVMFHIDGALLRVDPTQPGAQWLEPDSKYTVLVSGGVMDLSGNLMGKDHPFSFSTGYLGPPTVKGTVPTDNAIKVDTATTITIEFSRSMNWTSVQGALKLSPDAQGTFQQTGNSIVFKPSKPLKPGTTYSLTISKTAKDDKGNLLGTDYHWVFTTKEKPKTTTLGGSLMLPLLLVLIVIIVIIIVVAIVLRSRKKAKAQGNWNASQTAAMPPSAPVAAPTTEAPPPEPPAPEPKAEAPPPVKPPEPKAEAPPPAPVKEPEAPKPEPPQPAPAQPSPSSELDDLINELTK